jgi:hypothetical protein
VDQNHFIAFALNIHQTEAVVTVRGDQNEAKLAAVKALQAVIFKSNNNKMKIEGKIVRKKMN